MIKFAVHLNACWLQALKVYQSLFNPFIYKSMCINCKSPLYIAKGKRNSLKNLNILSQCSINIIYIYMHVYQLHVHVLVLPYTGNQINIVLTLTKAVITTILQKYFNLI